MGYWVSMNFPLSMRSAHALAGGEPRQVEVTMRITLDRRYGGAGRYVTKKPDDDPNMFIHNEVAKTVCRISLRKPAGGKVLGTGFFYGLGKSSETESKYIYLITASHVVQKGRRDGGLKVSVNDKKGVLRTIELPQEAAWEMHSTQDVAALRWDDTTQDQDVQNFPEDTLLTPELLAKFSGYGGIGYASQVLIPSMFSQYPGQNSNKPIVRTGTIAWPSETDVMVGGVRGDVMLIEALSMGGMSGAPVLVNEVGQFTHNLLSKVYIYGVIIGHYDERQDPRDEAGVNYGIACVVPSWRVRELLEQKALVEERRDEEEEELRKRSPSLD